jgi:hypothetical protein
MESKVQLCVVCAWREHCQKKYWVSKDPVPRCPDFSRDVTIKDKDAKSSPKENLSKTK